MSFLLGQPNSPFRAPTKRLHFHGIVLTICGLASVFNASVATFVEAEKSYSMRHFVNTHWISTVFLFAGLATVLTDWTKIGAFLHLTIGLGLVSMVVSFVSIIADVVNFIVVFSADWATIDTSRIPINRLQLTAMLVYSIFDIILCIFSFISSIIILWHVQHLSSRFYASVADYKSRYLFILAFGLLLVAVAKSLMWLIELIWLKNIGDQERIFFLHYTIDKPAWNAINYAVAVILMVLSRKGTRLLMHVTLAMISLSIYPTLIYLWVDYRLYSSIQISKTTIHLPIPPKVLLSNIVIGCVHLLLSLIIVILQIRALHKTGLQLFAVNMNLQPKVRQVVVYGGILLILAAFVLTIIDVANLNSRSFHRVFHPIDQKLPFFMVVSGILSLLVLHKKLTLYMLPTAFSMLLFTTHTSIFMVVAYMFLAYNAYFNDQLCELFHFGRPNCSIKLTRVAIWSHFIEASLGCCTFILSIYLAYMFARLMVLYRLHINELSVMEKSKKQVSELWIACLGWAYLVAGLPVLFICMFVRSSQLDISDHPLLTLHSTLYRSCQSLALVIFPLVQVCTYKNILFYPLRSLTLCILCLLRFVDVLTNLDYRSVGQDNGLAWTAFSLVELTSLGANFATVCLCLRLLDLVLNRTPQFQFGDANGVDDLVDGNCNF